MEIVKFRVVHFKEDRTVVEETDEILEGNVMRSEGEYLLVAVAGKELPYLVRKEDLR